MSTTRIYHFAEPQPLVVELHPFDCQCELVCEPHRPSAPRRLDGAALAKLTFAGIAVGHAIAAVVLGPGTVLRVLVANLTGQPL